MDRINRFFVYFFCFVLLLTIPAVVFGFDETIDPQPTPVSQVRMGFTVLYQNNAYGIDIPAFLCSPLSELKTEDQGYLLEYGIDIFSDYTYDYLLIDWEHDVLVEVFTTKTEAGDIVAYGVLWFRFAIINGQLENPSGAFLIDCPFIGEQNPTPVPSGRF